MKNTCQRRPVRHVKVGVRANVIAVSLHEVDRSCVSSTLREGYTNVISDSTAEMGGIDTPIVTRIALTEAAYRFTSLMSNTSLTALAPESADKPTTAEPYNW